MVRFLLKLVQGREGIEFYYRNDKQMKIFCIHARGGLIGDGRGTPLARV
jgi:hypothetical protein